MLKIQKRFLNKHSLIISGQILFVMIPLHAWVMWQGSKNEFVEVFVPLWFVYQMCTNIFSFPEHHCLFFAVLILAIGKFMSQQRQIILQKIHSLERDTAMPYLETFGVVLVLVMNLWKNLRIFQFSVYPWFQSKKKIPSSLAGIFSLWILAWYWWCWNEL